MAATISFAISVITFLFGGGVIVSFYSSIKSIKSSNNLIKLGLQAMLRDRILQGHKFYKQQGYITYLEMDTMLNLYNMYHNLGANGVMDEIIAEIKELPIK